jgi:hypothetical protein
METKMITLPENIYFDAIADESTARLQRARRWNHENLVGDMDILDADGTDAPARFNILSLPAWLAVALISDVAMVGAREIACANLRDFIAADEENPEARAAMQAFEAAVIDNLRESDILRFEQVATAETKDARSKGQPINNGTFISPATNQPMFSIYEDRFYMTLLDLGTEFIRAFARPRIEPKMIAGTFRGQDGEWPLEFRVFIENFEVVGISNYYPQIQPAEKAVQWHAAEALDCARRMVRTMREVKIGVGNASLAPDVEPGSDGAPAHPDGIPANWSRQDFTLDFITRRDGKMFFLEGGPAGLAAAHPCCFQQDGRDLRAPDALHGWALDATTPIRPLSYLDNIPT